MAYVINRYDGQAITTIEDGTVDQTLDIKLIGKNYAGYGEIQNENFVHMLENFARDSAPSNAIRGQLWYDTTAKKLKFYTGDQVAGVKVWKIAGGVEYGNEPSNPTAGDFWFDTNKSQLKVRTAAASWLVIGPQGAGSGTTQMVSRQVKGIPVGGNTAATYSIIASTINDEVIYVISKDEFVLDTSDADSVITGFSLIKRGLTLAYTSSSGISTTPTFYYWGTASDSARLGGYLATDYVRSGSSSFTSTVRFSDAGYTVGDSNDFKCSIEAGTDPVLENTLSSKIIFRVKDGSNVRTPLVINNFTVEPGVTSTFSLGSSTKIWANIYADLITGTATQANSLKVGSDYRTASTSAGVNTVAVRDGSGALTASVFNGVATSARYADLAEKYLADADYEVGTVVSIGGEKEVTACSLGHRALGAVSANPAYMMNSELAGGTYIALKGRVPVKVTGPVTKGQRLIAGDNGTAIAVSSGHLDVFAIALEDNQDAQIKIVECVIL